MKKYLFLLLVINYHSILSGQVNLVKNPSLENILYCPDRTDQIRLAKYWSCIDTTTYTIGTVDSMQCDGNCTPDYLNICGISGFSVPLSALGYQFPRTGNGYANVWMYDDSDAAHPSVYQRDYLMGRLYHSLIAGQSYCVTFYVNESNGAAFAINHIGAYLDDGSIDTNSFCGLPHTQYTPQVYELAMISDTLGWTKVEGSFTATGTERYITIGNFFSRVATDTIWSNPFAGGGHGSGSYYEVDDVSVIASDAHAYAGRDTTIHAGDSTCIGIDSNGEGMPCLWYTLGEPTPIDSGGRIRVHPAGTTTYIVAMDLCGTITYDTVVVTVADVGMNKLNEQFLHIYPNPAKDKFTIEGALGCEVRIYNVVGQLVTVSPCCHGEPCRTTTSRLTMTSNKEIVDISGLSKGVYIVEVCEPETGMRVSRRVVKE